MDAWNYVQFRYQSIENASDPRTNDWFLVGRPWPMIGAVTAYLLFVKYGTVMMKERKPFDLKYFMHAYNLGLVLLSAYMSIELFICAWSLNYNFLCDLIFYSRDKYSIRLASALWWYYISKVIEFIDTVIFILRKKNRQVSFLHVYHHSSMVALWWIGVKWYAEGSSFIPCMINSFVHFIMYSYYFLSGFGDRFKKYLWWKKCLTMLQLTQFITLMMYLIYGLANDCKYDKRPVFVMFLYLISHVLLFSNFYRHTYSKPKEITSKQVQSNGTVVDNKKVQ